MPSSRSTSQRRPDSRAAAGTVADRFNFRSCDTFSRAGAPPTASFVSSAYDEDDGENGAPTRFGVSVLGAVAGENETARRAGVSSSCAATPSVAPCVGDAVVSGVSGVEAHDIVGICAALAQRAITIWAITK